MVAAPVAGRLKPAVSGNQNSHKNQQPVMVLVVKGQGQMQTHLIGCGSLRAKGRRRGDLSLHPNHDDGFQQPQ